MNDRLKEANAMMREANDIIAQQAKDFIEAYDRVAEIDDLGIEHDGLIPAGTELPELFYLEVIAYGEEQAQINFRNALMSARKGLEQALINYHEVQTEAERLAYG